MIPHRSISNSKNYVFLEHILNLNHPEDGEQGVGLTVELGWFLKKGC